MSEATAIIYLLLKLYYKTRNLEAENLIEIAKVLM